MEIPADNQAELSIYMGGRTNFTSADGGTYKVTADNWETSYILDSETVLSPVREAFAYPGFIDGDTALKWFDRYVNYSGSDTSAGIGIGDVMSVLVSENHVDMITGVGWWD